MRATIADMLSSSEDFTNRTGTGMGSMSIRQESGGETADSRQIYL